MNVNRNQLTKMCFSKNTKPGMNDHRNQPW